MSDCMIDEKSIGEDAYQITLSTGVRDTRERLVGGIAHIRRHDGGYEFCMHAARDGSVFGALRPSHHAATYEAARFGVLTRLEQMLRRVRATAAGQPDGLYRTAGDLRRAKA